MNSRSVRECGTTAARAGPHARRLTDLTDLGLVDVDAPRARQPGMPGLGLVTIGTTPRPDYVEVFGSQLPPGTPLTVAGALDSLDDDEIAALAIKHRPGPYPLLCRLAHNGTTQEIDLQVLFPYIAEAARGLGRSGCAAVVVCCCGNFPAVEGCDVPVLFPGRVLPALARAMCTGVTPRIAVVSPIEGQCVEAEKHWRSQGFDPVMGFGDWTAEDRTHLEETAATLGNQSKQQGSRSETQRVNCCRPSSAASRAMRCWLSHTALYDLKCCCTAAQDDLQLVVLDCVSLPCGATAWVAS